MKKLLLIFVITILTIPVFADNYTVQKLPNGQTVVVYEIKNNPKVIEAYLGEGA